MASPHTFVQPGSFDGQVESFTTDVERVQIFFKANNVPAQKHQSVFLSIVGGTEYTPLLSPIALEDKSLDEMMAVLKAYYEPKPIIITVRFHFRRGNLLPGKSVARFIDEQLLAIPNLKLQDALDTATVMKAAATNSRAFSRTRWTHLPASRRSLHLPNRVQGPLP